MVDRGQFEDNTTVLADFRHSGYKNVAMMDGSVKPIRKGMTQYELVMRPEVP